MSNFIDAKKNFTKKAFEKFTSAVNETTEQVRAGEPSILITVTKQDGSSSDYVANKATFVDELFKDEIFNQEKDNTVTCMTLDGENIFEILVRDLAWWKKTEDRLNTLKEIASSEKQDVVKESKPKAKKKDADETIVMQLCSLNGTMLEDVIQADGTSAEIIEAINREMILRCPDGNTDALRISFNGSDFKSIQELADTGVLVIKN